MFGLFLSAAAPASADGPTGNKLRWLPYRASTRDAGRRVTVAARNTQPQRDTSFNPVRQAESSPFDDPFGDARTGSRRAQPVVMFNQAPTAAAEPGKAPPSAPTPSAKDPPGSAGAPADSAADPAASDDAAGQAGASVAPKQKQDTWAAAGTGDAPNGEKKIDFKCRSLKSLPSIDKLDVKMDVPAKLQEYKGWIDELACPLDDTELPDRETVGWQPITFTWKASGLCHKPLYFEQAHLERYGHSTGPLTQPLVSAGHFFLTVPVLPYKMGLYPPYECMYSLGYYRPGSCAPYHLDPIPLSVRAGLIEAGAVLGAIYIIP